MQKIKVVIDEGTRILTAKEIQGLECKLNIGLGVAGYAPTSITKLEHSTEFHYYRIPNGTLKS